MKKCFSVFAVILLVFTLLPVPGGAGMLCYTAESDLFTFEHVSGNTFLPLKNEVAKATFTAPGTGTVLVPATEVVASEGDGFTVILQKEGNEVFSYTVDGGKSLKLPEIRLSVNQNDKISFVADTRAYDGDSLSWKVSVLYQGGVAEAEALVNFIDLNSH
ncbi:MAG: hypothetical protein II351_01400, partial [Clostridia bacterium]|nr:hypothetical protein [Clostridia bacterium]